MFIVFASILAHDVFPTPLGPQKRRAWGILSFFIALLSVFTIASYRSFIAEDCEQLAQNIILVSQPRKLCDKLRKLLVENCTYKHTKQDHFSLVGDDVLQRKKFQTKEKIEMVDTVSQLFDDITDEQAVNFYKSRNVA